MSFKTYNCTHLNNTLIRFNYTCITKEEKYEWIENENKSDDDDDDNGDYDDDDEV